jgi:hypothetical protein
MTKVLLTAGKQPEPRRTGSITKENPLIQETFVSFVVKGFLRPKSIPGQTLPSLQQASFAWLLPHPKKLTNYLA